MSGLASDNEAASPAPGFALGEDNFCPECGYNLRGLTSDRCPECGFDVADLVAGGSAIPWHFRRKVGIFRAYQQTVWLALANTRRLAREICRPVSYADAQKFRWFSVATLAVPVVAAAIVTQTMMGFWMIGPTFGTGGLFLIWCSVWFTLGLAAMTGVPSYFFHPRYLDIQRQNRAIALSYYLSGLLPVVSLSAIIATLLLFALPPGSQAFLGVAIAIGALVPITFVLSMMRAAMLARFLLLRTSRVWLIVLLMPVLEFLVAALFWGFMPLSGYYLILVWTSVQ